MQNIKSKLLDLKTTKNKKSMPLLSFPCVSLLNCTVSDLISNSDMQAKGMKLVADRTPSFASVSLMDLSVEAEAFGANTIFSNDEVPTIVGSLITCEEDANALKVPIVGTKRTGVYIDAVKKAKELITDRPIFAGIIGSFSLAGRLLDVTEALMCCYTDPDMLHTVLKKANEFLINYALEYKKVGADGIVIAEPLTGLLSPDLASEFSEPYIRELITAVRDDNFAVIYHNCGNTAPLIIDSIVSVGADAYHFGNAVDMLDILTKASTDTLVMGNIDPVSEFKNGTPSSMETAVKTLMEKCSKYDNFVISSGCDIPHDAKWENIDAYYKAIDEFYKNN